MKLRIRFVLLSLALASPAAADELDTAADLIERYRYAEARKALEAAVRSAPASRADLLLADVCNRLGDWECGIEHGERAIEALPGESEAHYQLALGLRYKLTAVSKLRAPFIGRQYQKALQRALELEPEHLDAREEEIGWLTQAPKIGGGDRTLARQRVEELGELDWPRSIRMLAALEITEENDREAKGAYAELFERYPDHSQGRLEAAFWLISREEWRSADAHLAALELTENPVHHARALYQRGRIRVLGEWEQERAVELLRQYIETVDEALPVPARSHAYWRQGQALAQLGRESEARRAYERAIQIDSGNNEARRSLRALGG